MKKSLPTQNLLPCSISLKQLVRLILIIPQGLKFSVVCTLSLLLTLFLTANCLYAQENWVRYDQRNVNLRSIVIDAQGNKWISYAGGGGVYKFDGANWTNFNRQNSAIGSDTVYKIAIDHQGQLWFATQGGLSKYDGNSWANYITAGYAAAVTDIAIDKNDDVWTSVNGGSIYTFDGLWNYKQSMGDKLASDPGGYNIYVGNGSIINQYDVTTESWLENAIPILPVMLDGYRPTITTLDFDPHAMIHVGTDRYGMFENPYVHFDGSSGWSNREINETHVPGYNDLIPAINAYTYDKNNEEWIGLSNGLFTNTLTVYDITNSGLLDNAVTALAVDNQNNKWIGYSSGGLSKFDGTTWNSYLPPTSSISSNTVLSSVTDRQGNIWLGTSFGVSKFDGTAWTTYNTINSGLPNNYVSALAVDHLGNIWFGTQGGACKFDGHNWTTYNHSNSGIASDKVYVITIDANNQPWFGFGTAGFGISHFNGSDWTTYNSSNSPITSEAAMTIAIDQEAHIWIGTFNGVSRFDGTDWINYTSSNSSLIYNIVEGITIDEKGNKWFLTLNGISVFDGVNWTSYNSSNSGLVNNADYCMTIDSRGNKWIGTGGGVFLFDANNWTKYNGAASGITVAKVNCISVDNDGNKWIGTGSGVYKLSTPATPMQLSNSDLSTEKSLLTHGSTDFTQNNYLITTIAPSGVNPVTGNVAASVNVDQTVQTFNNQPYVQRHYEIEPAADPSGATATLTLYFSQADFDAYNNYITVNALTLPMLPTGPEDLTGISNIHISQYHGTGSAPGSYSGQTLEINPEDNNIIWDSENNWWKISIDVTGFSGFYLSAADPAALPLHLISFTATPKKRTVLLEWKAALSTASSVTYIERSQDGIHFNRIGSIVPGSSDEQEQQIKSFTDLHPYPGKSYYRLNIQNLDQQNLYSRILIVNMADEAGSLQLYPNPATSEITVANLQPGMTLSIYDNNGKLVKRLLLDKSTYNINISQLAPGLYHCRANKGTSNLYSSFIKLK